MREHPYFRELPWADRLRILADLLREGIGGALAWRALQWAADLLEGEVGGAAGQA